MRDFVATRKHVQRIAPILNVDSVASANPAGIGDRVIATSWSLVGNGIVTYNHTRL